MPPKKIVKSDEIIAKAKKVQTECKAGPPPSNEVIPSYDIDDPANKKKWDEDCEKRQENRLSIGERNVVSKEIVEESKCALVQTYKSTAQNDDFENTMAKILPNDWENATEEFKEMVARTEIGFTNYLAVAEQIGIAKKQCHQTMLYGGSDLASVPELISACVEMKNVSAALSESFVAVSSANIMFTELNAIFGTFERKIDVVYNQQKKNWDNINYYDLDDVFSLVGKMKEELEGFNVESLKQYPKDFKITLAKMNTAYNLSIQKMIGGSIDDVNRIMIENQETDKEIDQALLEKIKLESEYEIESGNFEKQLVLANSIKISEDLDKILNGQVERRDKQEINIKDKNDRMYRNEVANWHSISYDQEIQGDKDRLRVLLDERKISNEEIKNYQDVALAKKEAFAKNKTDAEGQSEQLRGNLRATEVRKDAAKDKVTDLKAKKEHGLGKLYGRVEKTKDPVKSMTFKAFMSETKESLEKASTCVELGNAMIAGTRVTQGEFIKKIELIDEGGKICEEWRKKDCFGLAKCNSGITNKARLINLVKELKNYCSVNGDGFKRVDSKTFSSTQVITDNGFFLSLFKKMKMDILSTILNSGSAVRKSNFEIKEFTANNEKTEKITEK